MSNENLYFFLLRIGVYLLLTVSQNFQQVQDCILQIQKRRLEFLGPFFERFFILGGPRGTRQKKLQKLGLNECAA
jgi:hypothetical protein